MDTEQPAFVLPHGRRRDTPSSAERLRPGNHGLLPLARGIHARRIVRLIEENLKTDFGSILDLIPVERGRGGHISRLRIVGTQETLVIGKELEIRRVLSHTHLFSSAFVVDKEDLHDAYPAGSSSTVPDGARRGLMPDRGGGHGSQRLPLRRNPETLL